jgi:hypothetical protein
MVATELLKHHVNTKFTKTGLRQVLSSGVNMTELLALIALIPINIIGLMDAPLLEYLILKAKNEDEIGKIQIEKIDHNTSYSLYKCGNTGSTTIHTLEYHTCVGECSQTFNEVMGHCSGPRFMFYEHEVERFKLTNHVHRDSCVCVKADKLTHGITTFVTNICYSTDNHVKKFIKTPCVLYQQEWNDYLNPPKSLRKKSKNVDPTTDSPPAHKIFIQLCGSDECTKSAIDIGVW